MARRNYQPQPNSPRGRAKAQIKGTTTDWTNPEVGYDASAGVPTALTAGDSQPKLDPTPFGAQSAPSTGVTSPVPAQPEYVCFTLSGE